MSGKWFDFEGMYEAAQRGDSADKLTPAQERAATLFVFTVIGIGVTTLFAIVWAAYQAVQP